MDPFRNLQHPTKSLELMKEMFLQELMHPYKSTDTHLYSRTSQSLSPVFISWAATKPF
jgi:hypothetical protein